MKGTEKRRERVAVTAANAIIIVLYSTLVAGVVALVWGAMVGARVAATAAVLLVAIYIPAIMLKRDRSGAGNGTEEVLQPSGVQQDN